jgi:tubulin polyglutamylase TTLL4
MIIIIIIILIFLFTPIFYLRLSTEIFVSYTKCKNKKIKKLKKDIFNKYNIDYREKDENWDIYLPCGYGNIENELKKIKVSNNNQIIFGVSGCDKIISKNNLWSLLNNYYGRNYAKTLMPESYVLNNSEDLKLFNKQFNPKKVYIIKKNIQRKKGIKLSNNLQEILNADKNYKVVQEFINDSYIINKRVMNLRIYLMIKCKNNVASFYIHKLGKCLYAAKDINKNLLDFDSRITNSYKVEKNIYDNNPLTFIELENYLNKKEKNSGTILFKNINTHLKELCLAIKDSIHNSNNLINNTTTQLFGIDIIFDNNMKPYILEINKGPDMVPKDNKEMEIKYKVEIDMLEIFNLLEIDDYKYNNGFIFLI